MISGDTGLIIAPPRRYLQWGLFYALCLFSTIGCRNKEAPLVIPVKPESIQFIPTSPEKAKINPIDGAQMVYIPAGEFLMGSTETDENANPDEKPQHRIYLDSYYIYKTEVTVAQYRKFCHATGRKMPPKAKWGWNDKYPIYNMWWVDAIDYAKWAGGSLPTEAQWEKAARGTDGRIYPWGNKWDMNKVHCSKKKIKDAASPIEAGSFPAGASPYGVLDMAGNAWELCSDLHDKDYYKSTPAKNPTGPVAGEKHVVRGGSWTNFDPIYFRCSNRSVAFPDYTAIRLGFRCVVKADK
jgi:formylglycine-generating enzyme required for sulfatase activity